MYVTRSEEQWKLLENTDPDQPVVMLNLIRYREHAAAGFGCDGMTGQEAYAEYGRRLRALAADFPGSPFWVGQAGQTFIGPTEETWDLVLLVRYESVSIFTEMLSSAAYQEAATARTAAVQDSRLVLTRQSFDAGDQALRWAISGERESSEQPIVMLNLIRYREAAMGGHTCDGMTGEQAYAEYLRRLQAMDDHDFPGHIIWDGNADMTIIGPSQDRWDRVLLIGYESADEFRRMAGSDAYKTAGPARTAAVLDSRLVLMHQQFPRA